METVQDRR